MKSQLYEKVYGCLVGGAIGDAFGIRVEMMHYRDIEVQYGRVTHFDALPPRQPSQQSPLERWYPFGVQHQNVDGFHPLGCWSHETGAYTDDMRYRLMACQAIPCTVVQDSAAQAGSHHWRGPGRRMVQLSPDD